MKSVSLTTLGEEAFVDFLKSFDTILIDCDGVLWLGGIPIPGADLALNRLRDKGKKVFYVTNNSTKSRVEFVQKCKKFGFQATTEEILSSAYLTACFLNDNNFEEEVYVVGTSGITKELDEIGIKCNVTGPDPMDCDLATLPCRINLNPKVGAVVVGFDPDISFPKIMKAATYLKDQKCLFLATNTDQQFPLKADLVTPGAGCMVAAIECCADREPIVIGKPGAYIREFLKKHYNIDPRRTLMIGDRGNTDILLGTRCGFQTLMVLTGISSLKDIEKWEKSEDPDISGCVPDYFINSISDIVPLL